MPGDLVLIPGTHAAPLVSGPGLHPGYRFCGRNSRRQHPQRCTTKRSAARSLACICSALIAVALCWPPGVPAQGFTQATVQDAGCNDAQSTAAMRECENGRFKRADAGMNAAFRNLSAGLDRSGRAKLRAAQQAWIRFRDAEADYQADAERGGTLAPLIATSVRADLTESRRKELEKAVSEPK